MCNSNSRVPSPKKQRLNFTEAGRAGTGTFCRGGHFLCNSMLHVAAVGGLARAPSQRNFFRPRRNRCADPPAPFLCGKKRFRARPGSLPWITKPLWLPHGEPLNRQCGELHLAPPRHLFQNGLQQQAQQRICPPRCQKKINNARDVSRKIFCAENPGDVTQASRHFRPAVPRSSLGTLHSRDSRCACAPCSSFSQISLPWSLGIPKLCTRAFLIAHRVAHPATWLSLPARFFGPAARIAFFNKNLPIAWGSIYHGGANRESSNCSILHLLS